MMQGIVDQNCEATIRLVLGNVDSQRQMIDAVIDTGFTGFLTLPSSVLADLNLRAYRREEGILGDGSTCVFDVYRGLVIWDGELRRIDINESDTEPLVGMSLLYGYRMQLDAIEGGTVTIQALSSLR
ncbi:clan AA aspartic protease [Microcystis aeruginosa]|jgi:clan AA aspartic protease|uniref:Clan AA aspartic protease n=2 Tax=Microcystis TaxID=1125 RepID=A0A552HN74_MICVR|nr:clan AA aspartic protease [Microcystis aeruginosa]NCR09350.1 clan AA aspartic protease [Microcystis aeruginosa LG13-11]TRU72669.1 MAG: clan AA aspartic protease [Microcystis viridis Mv_BB_P_19951000_S68D]TRU74795.1 MAG: clan AA aspartic protease [Microcystis viridis Mv_BB_P_19951000_S68]TRU77758.1 MAG: clan AA aspartic protease [Microcystis viridis Mv_BB_P_19951000_S69]TRU87279.1 MAG: clan AA aspartic protease [Microcystis viridis Mv_BB_P_19951000_S69D]